MHARKNLAAISVGVALALGLGLGTARAEQWSFVGTRYQGMGGAGVAVADDSQAAYWNPGALGLVGAPDAHLFAGAQAAAEGPIFRDLDQIAEFVETVDIQGILDDIEAGNPLSNADLQDALELSVDLFPRLNAEGQGFVASANAGLTGRWGRIAISGLGLGNSGIQPVFDLDNLSFNSAVNAGEQINNAFGALPPGGPFTNPASQALADSLAAIFGAVPGVTDAQNAAENLVFQAEQAGIDTGDAAVQDVLNTIADATATLGAVDLADNGSGAFIRSAVVGEAGISVGYALPWLEQTISIGSSAKYLFGATSFKFVRYNEVDDAKDLIREITDKENIEYSHNFGIDLGILVQPVEMLRIGIVGRNLNSPKFDVKGGGHYTLDRQVRAGVAVRPFPIWLIALDVDLTENESGVLPGLRSRLISGGTEIAIPIGPVGLALRAGAYANLASGIEHTVAITAGLGLKVGGLQLDLAAGASPDTTNLEAGGDYRIPSRANLSAELSWKGIF